MPVDWCTVHITYPRDRRQAQDHQTWLAAVVDRHQGELSESVMESWPAQQFAWFQTVASGQEFVAELTGSGQWEAALSLGQLGR